MADQQAAATVLMIRPAAFAANAQTAASNHFQSAASIDQTAIRDAAIREFDASVHALRQAGVDVLVVEDHSPPERPDAIFPNNWFSTHADGTFVLYPLLAENRRLERRKDLPSLLTAAGFNIARTIDLTDSEQVGSYLEGTGSLVLDRVNRVVYAGLSPRTSASVLDHFASTMGYRVVTFDSRDSRGRAIYHTNVMLSIGRRFAIVCLDSIGPSQRDAVRESLLESGRQLIELSFTQIESFAGNLLELQTQHGGHCIALSAAAARSLTSRQRDQLESLGGPLVTSDLATIERHGGGSFRCMLAEIHLPRSV